MGKKKDFRRFSDLLNFTRRFPTKWRYPSAEQITMAADDIQERHIPVVAPNRLIIGLFVGKHELERLQRQEPGFIWNGTTSNEYKAGFVGGLLYGDHHFIRVYYNKDMADDALCLHFGVVDELSRSLYPVLVEPEKVTTTLDVI